MAATAISNPMPWYQYQAAQPAIDRTKPQNAARYPTGSSASSRERDRPSAFVTTAFR